MLHRSDQLIENGALEWRRLALHLNTDARMTEAKCLGRRQDVDAAVRALVTSMRGETLRIQNSLNQFLQAVTGVLAVDLSGDLIPAALFRVNVARRSLIGRPSPL